MSFEFIWEDLVLDRGQRKHLCACCEPSWRLYNALGLFALGSLPSIQGHLNARGYIAILEQDLCSTLLAFGFNFEEIIFNHFETMLSCIQPRFFEDGLGRNRFVFYSGMHNPLT